MEDERKVGRPRRRKKATKPTVEVDVLIRFPDGVGRVAKLNAKFVERQVQIGMAEAYPRHALRGIWVHEDLPRAVDRRSAVDLILRALDPEVQRDPSAYMIEAIEVARKLRS